MRYLAFILFWSLVTPVVAWADAVRITSGEHATFSRIVIYFQESVAWRFGRSENGYVFEYDGPSIVFQAEEVFRFIPRRRVLDLEVNSVLNRIALTVSCECTADAFELRDGQIVLDFKDGSPNEYSRFEAPVGAPRVSVQPLEQVTLDVTDAEIQRAIAPVPVAETRVSDLGAALTIERWSREFRPVVKVDQLVKEMIQNDETKEPFA